LSKANLAAQAQCHSAVLAVMEADSLPRSIASWMAASPAR
jgi:hypothetical protein